MKTILTPITVVSLLVCTGFVAMAETTRTITYTAPQKAVSEVGFRVVSAYTLGRVEENDSKPCEGAYGDDLCELARKGVEICASNEFPKGTELIVGDGVECVVMDRMNSRYKTEIDLAMLNYDDARSFGRNKLEVKVK